eukprot:7665411-Lingulodinium_polyedra.AAC.1
MPAPREVPISGGCVVLDLSRWRGPVGALGRPYNRFTLSRLSKEGLAVAHGPGNAGAPHVVPLRVLAA